jgi:hypothetical protein
MHGKQNMEMFEDEVSEVHALGAAEIVVNNLRTAFKLIK